jgi:hypothetical protein
VPRKAKVGHSHRWCETCRLYIEWLRWSQREPFGLYTFLWNEYGKHRRSEP